MDDLKNITIASTIMIGISEYALKFGFPKKYIMLLNLVTSIVVSFFFVDQTNVKDMIISVLFLTITSSGANVGMGKLGKKINKSKKDK